MEHKLKAKSSFIVVVLRSLRHKACVRCEMPIKSFEDSFAHWRKELELPTPLFQVEEKAKSKGTDYDT